jgi:hypothetical protein
MIIHGDGNSPDPNLLALCDVQITDPPYSDHVHDGAMSSHTLATGGPRKRELGYDAITPADRDAIAFIASLLPRWTIVHSDLESTHLWRDAMAVAGVEYIRQWDWVRWVQPQQSGDRPGQGSEAVLHFHPQIIGARGGVRPKTKHWNGDGGKTHYDTRGIRGDDKRQGQKPIGLVLTLVSWYSDPDECVFDGRVGAGTTALACRLLGREHIGYELDEEWSGRAAERELAEPCARDLAQIRDWCDEIEAECARTMPAMQGPEAHNALRRAQARLADVAGVRKAIK